MIVPGPITNLIFFLLIDSDYAAFNTTITWSEQVPLPARLLAHTRRLTVPPSPVSMFLGMSGVADNGLTGTVHKQYQTSELCPFM